MSSLDSLIEELGALIEFFESPERAESEAAKTIALAAALTIETAWKLKSLGVSDWGDVSESARTLRTLRAMLEENEKSFN